MLTIRYRSLKDEAMHPIKEFRSGAWLHLEEPTEEEIEAFAAEHHLEAGHLKDALDPFEVPRFEVEGSAIYVFARYPIKNEESFETVPFLIVLTETAVITATSRKLPDLKAFVAKADVFTTQKTKLLLQLFSWMNQSYTSYLYAINKTILTLRKQLQLENIRNRDIARFVVLEDTLQDFMSALDPTSVVLNHLLSGRHVQFFETDKDLVEDLVLNTNQLTELCRGLARSIVTIREAYSTIMTNNLNRVIKFLTALTIILMAPNLIFSFYGMNVHLPFTDSSNAFEFITGGVAAVTLALVALFFKLKWL